MHPTPPHLKKDAPQQEKEHPSNIAPPKKDAPQQEQEHASNSAPPKKTLLTRNKNTVQLRPTKKKTLLSKNKNTHPTPAYQIKKRKKDRRFSTRTRTRIQLPPQKEKKRRSSTRTRTRIQLRPTKKNVRLEQSAKELSRIRLELNVFFQLSRHCTIFRCS
jgi:hypothetical protein